MRPRAESRKPPPRDMDASPFALILSELVARIPGAYAAALVDREGETVDYSGHVDPFDVKIAAAELGIALSVLKASTVLGEPRWFIVRANKKSLMVHALPDGYATTILLRKYAGFTSSLRALLVARAALAKEAEWPLDSARWYAVEVQTEGRRPVAVTHLGQAYPVVILGTVVGLGARERGFRVRTELGNELTLVREAGDWWYTDDAPGGGADSAPR